MNIRVCPDNLCELRNLLDVLELCELLSVVLVVIKNDCCDTVLN